MSNWGESSETRFITCSAQFKQVYYWSELNTLLLHRWGKWRKHYWENTQTSVPPPVPNKPSPESIIPQ